MDYTFKNDIKASDFWLLTITQTYRAWTGIVNIVFTLAMAGLLLRFYSGEHPVRNILLIMGCMIFTVFQPFFMYLFSVKQVEGIPKEMILTFNDRGLRVDTADDSQTIPWKKVSRIVRAKNMIIIYTSGASGYMLSNRMLGEKKEEFYNYCVDHMKRAAAG